mmetsp:Transcript_2212/g.9583  ORF Transcript_2212/g.9583 Transcript_2212/m.9583 type:complete len:297 (-) Transcript_2212:380-1270(-)|eukprot:scaffold300_cov258-Pinguiococcus_pyrenoidosus.AAC.72
MHVSPQEGSAHQRFYVKLLELLLCQKLVIVEDGDLPALPSTVSTCFLELFREPLQERAPLRCRAKRRNEVALNLRLLTGREDEPRVASLVPHHADVVDVCRRLNRTMQRQLVALRSRALSVVPNLHALGIRRDEELLLRQEVDCFDGKLVDVAPLVHRCPASEVVQQDRSVRGSDREVEPIRVVPNAGHLRVARQLKRAESRARAGVYEVDRALAPSSDQLVGRRQLQRIHALEGHRQRLLKAALLEIYPVDLMARRAKQQITRGRLVVQATAKLGDAQFIVLAVGCMKCKRAIGQ